MRRTTRRSEIITYIVNEIDTHPQSIAVRAAHHFGISKQAVMRHVNALIAEGSLEASGNTKARQYRLADNFVLTQNLTTAENNSEDKVFRDLVRPVLGGIPDNVMAICEYGFTEMFNNVLDHSESETVSIRVSRTPAVVEMIVSDQGIGIFRKIKDALKLDDVRKSMFEISKGKMTTNPNKHSGEGIFFTSRVFDHFSIFSEEMLFWHRINHDDWLTEDRTICMQGTSIRMRICTHSTTTIKEVFDSFATPEHEYDFAKTHVPVALAQYGDGQLVSRSQAKRVLARFDKFKEVMLDFLGVQSIGQAFADEIFRVFRRENPNIEIQIARANDDVNAMIQRATNAYLLEKSEPAQTAKK